MISKEGRRKLSELHKGERNLNWKGGKSRSNKGYIIVLQPDGRYAKEHRLVMEERLGRPLTKGEVVHHQDGDKTNNRAENLELMSKNEHDSRNAEIRTRDGVGRFA